MNCCSYCSLKTREFHAGVHAHCDACTTCLLEPIFRRCIYAIFRFVFCRSNYILQFHANISRTSFAISKHYFNATSRYIHDIFYISFIFSLAKIRAGLHQILINHILPYPKILKLSNHRLSIIKCCKLIFI